jgi:uncharacterized protein (DUF983 family)
MAICPKCENGISYSQVIKYTNKTPITCGSCSATLGFDKKDWRKLCLPIIILLIINAIVVTMKHGMIPLLLVLAFLIPASINFFWRLNSIKLNEQL